MQHKAQTQPSNKPAGKVLPAERTQAMHQLIKLTQGLSDIAERESQALAQNDLLSFAILQDEKSMIAERYALASAEFRARLAEFRGVDKTLLARLEKLQIRLGEQARENNAIVGRVYQRSQQNTMKTLLAAQEMGQNVQIDFANNNTQNQGE